jgi:hypothetical protein
MTLNNGLGPLFRGSAIPRVRYSGGPPFRGSAIPGVRYSGGPQRMIISVGGVASARTGDEPTKHATPAEHMFARTIGLRGAQIVSKTHLKTVCLIFDVISMFQ